MRQCLENYGSYNNPINHDERNIMDERLDQAASEICEIMEGAGRDVNQVYGELVRELVQEGKFTNEEIGKILNAVEEKVEFLNEWYEKMNIERAFPM